MADERKKLTDKVVIVTGASMGIGRDTAKLFAQHGAKVVLAARKQELLQQLADEILKQGGSQPLVIPTDVTDRAQVEQLINKTIQHFGRIDILINNAGAGLHAP